MPDMSRVQKPGIIFAGKAKEELELDINDDVSYTHNGIAQAGLLCKQ